MKEFYMMKQNDGRIYADRNRKEIWLCKLQLKPAMRLQLEEQGFVINEKGEHNAKLQ
jgi:hypothetical protein